MNIEFTFILNVVIFESLHILFRNFNTSPHLFGGKTLFIEISVDEIESLDIVIKEVSQFK